MRAFLAFCAHALVVISMILGVLVRADDTLDAVVSLLVAFALYFAERALQPRVDRLIRKSLGFVWVLAGSHMFRRPLASDELRSLHATIYAEVFSAYPYRMVAKKRPREWRFTIISGVTRLRVDLRWRSTTFADVLISRHVPLMSAMMFVLWVVLTVATLSEHSKVADATLNILIVVWLSSLAFSVLLRRWSTFRFSNASMQAVSKGIEEACRKVDLHMAIPLTQIESAASGAKATSNHRRKRASAKKPATAVSTHAPKAAVKPAQRTRTVTPARDMSRIVTRSPTDSLPPRRR